MEHGGTRQGSDPPRQKNTRTRESYRATPLNRRESKVTVLGR